MRQLDEWLDSCREFEVMRFIGWVPGSFWVNETTDAKKLTEQSSAAFRPESRLVGADRVTPFTKRAESW